MYTAQTRTVGTGHVTTTVLLLHVLIIHSVGSQSVENAHAMLYILDISCPPV